MKSSSKASAAKTQFVIFSAPTFDGARPPAAIRAPHAKAFGDLVTAIKGFYLDTTITEIAANCDDWHGDVDCSLEIAKPQCPAQVSVTAVRDTTNRCSQRRIDAVRLVGGRAETR
jgi:hypothetical protein